MLNAENLRANIQIALSDLLGSAKSVSDKLCGIWVKSDHDDAGKQRLSDFLNDIPIVKQKIPHEKLVELFQRDGFSGVAIVVFFRKVAASDKLSFSDAELNDMIGAQKNQKVQAAIQPGFVLTATILRAHSDEASPKREKPQVRMPVSSSSSSNSSGSSSSSSSSAAAAAEALVSLSAKRKPENPNEGGPRAKIPRRDYHQGRAAEQAALQAESLRLEGLQEQLQKDQAALAAQQAVFHQAQAQLASDQAQLQNDRGEMAAQEASIRGILTELIQQTAASNRLREEINAARSQVDARIRMATHAEAKALVAQQKVRAAEEELRRGQEQLEARFAGLLEAKREAAELSAQANAAHESATREQGLASARIQAAEELERRALAAAAAAAAAEVSLRAARAELEAKTASDREHEKAWRERLDADLDARCRAFEARREREERQQQFAQSSWVPGFFGLPASMAPPGAPADQKPAEPADDPDNPFGLG